MGGMGEGVFYTAKILDFFLHLKGCKSPFLNNEKQSKIEFFSHLK